MTPRPGARSASRGASLLAVLLAVSCGRSGEGPANVILLVVDTLRADRLGCYGYARATSPHIDSLAARGTLYRSCRAQGTWTGPSMISMLTGLYVSDEEERLPAGHPVLGELLQAAGFTTAAFAGNPILTADRGMARGFDYYEGPIPGGCSARVFDRFRGWYEQSRAVRSAERGFFVWLHVADPHTPYEPAERFRRFTGQPLPGEEALCERWRQLEPEPPAAPRQGKGLTFEQAVALIRAEGNLYDSEVLAADWAVGELLRFLEEQGELERTLFMLASDHGEELYEHAKYPQDLRVWSRQSPTGMGDNVKDLLEWAHGSCFHEEVWRVPLLFAGPGFPAGVRRDGLAANLDILPTVLDALGLDPPPGLPGESLLGGVVPARRQVFGYSRRAAAVYDARGLKFVDRRRKRDIYPEWARGSEEGAALQELFDLNDDPSELQNVLDQRPQAAAALCRTLDRWFEETARDVDRRLSDADREALRQLGYLNGW